MIYERHAQLIERKNKLGWTNRECGNAMGISPAMAGSKLNGFCVLTSDERRKLEQAMAVAENLNNESKE